jgi:hypothetical protein
MRLSLNIKLENPNDSVSTAIDKAARQALNADVAFGALVAANIKTLGAAGSRRRTQLTHGNAEIQVYVDNETAHELVMDSVMKLNINHGGAAHNIASNILQLTQDTEKYLAAIGHVAIGMLEEINFLRIRSHEICEYLIGKTAQHVAYHIQQAVQGGLQRIEQDTAAVMHTNLNFSNLYLGAREFQARFFVANAQNALKKMMGAMNMKPYIQVGYAFSQNYLIHLWSYGGELVCLNYGTLETTYKQGDMNNAGQPLLLSMETELRFVSHIFSTLNIGFIGDPGTFVETYERIGLIEKFLNSGLYQH